MPESWVLNSSFVVTRNTGNTLAGTQQQVRSYGLQAQEQNA